jgi:flagellar biosynthetic protein FliQ
MTIDQSLELLRNVFLMAATVAGPPLATALVIGLIVGILQTATQVNEATVLFVVKVLGVGIIVAALGPTMVRSLVEYTRETIGAMAKVVR